MSRRKREVMTDEQAWRLYRMKLALKIGRQSGSEAWKRMFPDIVEHLEKMFGAGRDGAE